MKEYQMIATDFPTNGAVITLHCNDRYLKAEPRSAAILTTAREAAEWERFIVEVVGDRFALKHEASDLYVGREIKHDSQPSLVEHLREYEQFTFENRDGFIGIKSCQNTYLCCLGENQIIWKDDAGVEDCDTWRVDVLSGGKETRRNRHSGLTVLPKKGQRVGIFSKGKFVGLFKKKFKPVGLVERMNINEVFVVGSNGSRFCFMQEVSGLYLGGDTTEGYSPSLVGKRCAGEEFVLTMEPNGFLTIMSNKSTYLCCTGSKVFWKNNPDANQQYWVLVPEEGIFLNPSFDDSRLNIVTEGTGVIYNNHGIIGLRKQLRQKLGLAKRIKEWEQFSVEKISNSEVAFKQVISGFYIGGTNDDKKTPFLVTDVGACERMTIEDRGRSQLAIRSASRTYLCCSEGELVWRSNLDITGLWVFKVTNKNPDSRFPTFSRGSFMLTYLSHQ